MIFEEQLTAGMKGALAVMGIGNPLRGDDGAGSLVARCLGEWPGVSVIDARETPEDYLVQVVNLSPDVIVLIDCVDLGAEPGSVAFLEQDQVAESWPSTHRMPMSMLIAILRRETQARVFGIGIQPAHTDFLKPMSDEVAESVAYVAEMLNDALARGRASAGSESALRLKGEVHA